MEGVILKVTVYQAAPQLLDVKSNLEDVIMKIHHAREKGAQLVVFPELALTGYFVRDRYPEAALRLDSYEIKSLAAASKGTAAVVGFIGEQPERPDNLHSHEWSNDDIISAYNGQSNVERVM